MNTRYLSVLSGPRRPMELLFASLLALASVALIAVPAAADNDDHRGRGHDKQRQRNDDGGHRWRGEWRGESRSRDYGATITYPRPYLYSQPVYVPPPVYYVPRQSPGISLFFPLDLR